MFTCVHLSQQRRKTKRRINNSRNHNQPQPQPHHSIDQSNKQSISQESNQVNFNQINQRKTLNCPKFPPPKKMIATLWQVTILETNSGDQPVSPKELVLKRPLGTAAQLQESGNSPMLLQIMTTSYLNPEDYTPED